MSICDSGIKSNVSAGEIVIHIEDAHPLILLATMLPWETMFELIFQDLKNTTKKKKGWLGRKLTGRIHLGAYILQQRYNLTDRQTEYSIKDNAA